MFFKNHYMHHPYIYSPISFPIPEMTRGIINSPITLTKMRPIEKLVVTIFPVTGNSYFLYVCCIE